MDAEGIEIVTDPEHSRFTGQAPLSVTRPKTYGKSSVKPESSGWGERLSYPCQAQPA